MTDEKRGLGAYLPRRWWLWALILLVLVARVALPEVLRRVAESKASELLRTKVQIGDVDLSLLGGGVALEDVKVQSPNPADAGEGPLIAWKRLAVGVRYLPLFRKTVRFKEIVLDAPRIVLDRLASGEINLQRLVPESDAASSPAEPAPAGSGWKIGIDSLALRGGGIRFRDLMLPEGGPLEIRIPDIVASDVSLERDLYGQPGRARLTVKTEGGTIRADTQFRALGQGFGVTTNLKAEGLPLRRARVYVPGVGWSELGGELDAAIDYDLEGSQKNTVRGLVRLRDVHIQIPGLEQAAFACQRLAVRVDPIDLLAQRATVSAVEIVGASVVMDLRGDEPLPLLRKPGPKAPAPSPMSATPTTVPPPAPATPPPSPPAAATAAQPWQWVLRRFTLDGSRVHLLTDGDPVDIDVTASASGLTSDADKAGRAQVRLGVGAGTFEGGGMVRVNPPGFGGSVHVQQLPVHDLVRAARAAAALPQGLTKAATLGADLTIEADLDQYGFAPPFPEQVRVRGRVGVTDVDLAGDDRNLFAVGWKALEIPIEDVRVPGALPGASRSAQTAPIRVALGAITFDEPQAQLTRDPLGIVVPPPWGPADRVVPAPVGTSPPAEGKPVPPVAPAATTKPAPPPVPPEKQPSPPAAAAPPGRVVDVTAASFALRRGRIGFTDQTVKPFFSGEIRPLDIDARGIRSIGPTIDRFTVRANTVQRGLVEITGTLKPEGGSIVIDGKDLALMPYNPYATHYSSYSLGSGGLSVRTTVTFGGGRYDTKTALTLHQLAVRGAEGDALFKQQFGIPLTMAIALMSDLNGDIKLDVPVLVDEKGATIGVGTVVGGALRSALLGAITSPLKLLGAGLRGGSAALEPSPIPMRPGRAEPTSDGEKQLATLGEFLSGRPGVAVELTGVATPADVRAQREQALRAELEERSGFLNALRDLPARGAKKRILAALAERAEGGSGTLDADDTVVLEEWLAARPPAAPDAQQVLAAERAQRVAAVLREQRGIPASRVTIAKDAATPGGEVPAPVVRLTFGATGAPSSVGSAAPAAPAPGPRPKTGGKRPRS